MKLLKVFYMMINFVPEETQTSNWAIYNNFVLLSDEMFFRLLHVFICRGRELNSIQKIHNIH